MRLNKEINRLHCYNLKFKVKKRFKNDLYTCNFF